ncbi:MAG: hypothetical protein M1361_01420 [Patescibacteria group bacterium]|nr:hypothetical protein [Patescibacteria group bacterium]MCL5224259.1 hypothetical protein [Patescibacteria group bacterium]
MVGIKFDFIVDKEACFAYWAQLLVHRKRFWAIDREYEYYRQLAGVLNELEKTAVGRLQLIFDNDKNGSWLPNRYISSGFRTLEERESWQLIRSALNAKFEEVWQRESPALYSWQSTLSNYSLSEFEPVLNKIANFWGIGSFSRTVRVKLFFYWRNDFTQGYSYRGVKDFIFLGISHMDPRGVVRVLSTLIHEVTHLFENESPLSREAFMEFISVLYGANLEKEEPDWRYLFNESIIKSIASGGPVEDYVFRSIFGGKTKLKSPESEPVVRSKETHNSQILWIVPKILDATTAYIDNDKRIDRGYVEEVAAAWIELRGLMKQAADNR